MKDKSKQRSAVDLKLIEDFPASKIEFIKVGASGHKGHTWKGGTKTFRVRSKGSRDAMAFAYGGHRS